MFANKTVVAAGLIGSLLGLFIGTLIGIVMGNRVALQMWAGPDYADRLLDRCFFEASASIEAKKQGLARFWYGDNSLTSCLTLLDFANGNLYLSEDQQIRLRQQKKMILKNFPGLATPAAGQKPAP